MRTIEIELNVWLLLLMSIVLFAAIFYIAITIIPRVKSQKNNQTKRLRPQRGQRLTPVNQTLSLKDLTAENFIELEKKVAKENQPNAEAQAKEIATDTLLFIHELILKGEQIKQIRIGWHDNTEKLWQRFRGVDTQTKDEVIKLLIQAGFDAQYDKDFGTITIKWKDNILDK